jgi:bacillithiol system protein YtxJ
MGIFDKLFGSKEDEFKPSAGELEWYNLGSISDLEAAISYSHKEPILLFKHSTRCSISSSALERLKRNWSGQSVKVRSFYLDLLNHKDVSQEIATRLGVEHQSPQMLLVKDGVAVFNSSHMDIDFNDVKAYAPA